MWDDRYNEIDENIDPCKGCEDYIDGECISKGGCGKGRFMEREYIVMIKDPYNEAEPMLLSFKDDNSRIILRVKKVINRVKNNYPHDYQWIDLIDALKEEFGEQFLGEKDFMEAYW